MPKETELKPCPFCGGKAFKDIVTNKFGALEGSIACDCGARGEEVESLSEPDDCVAIEHLIKAWNTRADQVDNTAALEALDRLDDMVRKYIEKEFNGTTFCEKNMNNHRHNLVKTIREYLEA